MFDHPLYNGYFGDLSKIKKRATLPSHKYDLLVAQQPIAGQVLANHKRPSKSQTLKPPQQWALDPPAVVELRINDEDPSLAFLHSPYWFCVAEIVPEDPVAEPVKPDTLKGIVSSSLHVVKPKNDKEARGYFVFGELYPNYPGIYHLRFSLFEMRNGNHVNPYAAKIADVRTDPFEVRAYAKVPSPRASTDFTRTLVEGGVKLRLRKEPVRRSTKKERWGIPHSQAQASYHQPLPTTVIGPQNPYQNQYLGDLVQPGYSSYPATTLAPASNIPQSVDITSRLSVQHQSFGGAQYHAQVFAPQPTLNTTYHFGTGGGGHLQTDMSMNNTIPYVFDPQMPFLNGAISAPSYQPQPAAYGSFVPASFS